MPAGFLTKPGSLLPCPFSGKQPVTGQLIRDTILANDIITQLQARNETLTQAIARYGSLNASTLHTLSFEQTKSPGLRNSSLTPPFAGKRTINSAPGCWKTQTFAGQLGKLLNVETPDWKLPYEFQGNMVDMAAKGGMDNTARDALSLNIRDWSLDFNQDQKICKAPPPR